MSLEQFTYSYIFKISQPVYYTTVSYTHLTLPTIA